MIPGSTDQRVRFYAMDASTKLPATGLAYNETGISVWYQRDGGAKTAITLAAGTGLSDTHSDGAWNEIDNGWYQVDAPDAAFVAGARSVQFGGTITDYVLLGESIDIESISVTISPISGVTLGTSNFSRMRSYYGELRTLAPVITDANGNAVDFTGITLEVVYELQDTLTDVAVVSSGSISVSSNTVTWQVPSAVATYATSRTLFRFALRNADSPEDVYLNGEHELLYAPRNDA